MEGLSLSIATTSSTSGYACNFRLRIPSSNFRNYWTNIPLLPRKPRNKLLIFAASDNESELRKWMSMELEWESLIDEDPQLTLVKIIGRKSYPGLTDLELHELYEKKGKAAFPELDELPDLSEIRRKPEFSETNEVPSNVSEKNGLKLVQSEPKKELEDEINYGSRALKKQSQTVVKTVDKSLKSGPSITLRRPSSFYDDNIETNKSLGLSEEWNLSLEMSERQSKERLIDSKLVRKPDPYILKDREEASQEVQAVVNNAMVDNSAKAIRKNNIIPSGTSTIVSYMQEPEKVNLDLNADPKQEKSGGQERSNSGMETLNTGSSTNVVEHENFSINPAIKEHEDRDWARAEDLIKEGRREEVELISASTGGFVVSFGSLIGFLPYHNVATRWRYLPFESWLRKKGLDPSKYKQYLGVVGKYEATNVNTSLDSSVNSKAANEVKAGFEISPDTKLDDLFVIYDQEKLNYSSSFVGQKFKVYVVLADRESRKLIFSAKQKEKEESILKKKILMAKLRVGDVVKCCITKINYFGIFVEVEGVPALIQLTELPWDNILDLSSHFKRGQVIEAKVIQLDFSRGHILLSLKEIKVLPPSRNDLPTILVVDTRFIWHPFSRVNTSYLIDLEPKYKRY